MAVVVLVSARLVYSLGGSGVVGMAGVVAVVGVGVVDLALDLLAYLVADSFQRGNDLDMEKRLEGALTIHCTLSVTDQRRWPGRELAYSYLKRQTPASWDRGSCRSGEVS